METLPNLVTGVTLNVLMVIKQQEVPHKSARKMVTLVDRHFHVKVSYEYLSIVSCQHMPFKTVFYCATVAYHVELSVFLGGRRHPSHLKKNKRIYTRAP